MEGKELGAFPDFYDFYPEGSPRITACEAARGQKETPKSYSCEEHRAQNGETWLLDSIGGP